MRYLEEHLGLDPAGWWAARQDGRRLPADRLVVKLVRALGGCLGVRRRRRTWLAAISHGEPQAGVDPWMSEWGNPVGVMPDQPPGEFIAGG